MMGDSEIKGRTGPHIFTTSIFLIDTYLINAVFFSNEPG